MGPKGRLYLWVAGKGFDKGGIREVFSINLQSRMCADIGLQAQVLIKSIIFLKFQ